MFTIRKADTADCQLINKLAWQVFPETYKDILTPAQIDYMMDWMYSPENIRKQMEEEGHVYLLAYEECEAAGYVSVQPEGEDLFHLQKIYVLPYFQKAHCGSSSTSRKYIPLPAVWNSTSTATILPSASTNTWA